MTARRALLILFLPVLAWFDREAAEPAELGGTEWFGEAFFVSFLVMWDGGFFVCLFVSSNVLAQGSTDQTGIS